MSAAAADSPAAVPQDEPAPDTGARYAKTDAGHAEVRGRTLTLSRGARNLLLIIEPGRPAAAWMAMVQGCGPEALRTLLAAGLVGVADATAPRPATPALPAALAAVVTGTAPAAAAAAPRIPLSQALASLSYRTLYERITAQARPQLGLIKGYKLILEMERCAGPDEARTLALRFVEQVREAAGDAAAQALAEGLAAPEAADR
ncbi:hypothetical protein [Aquabacterium sp. OR-4]|uniref:hypothetical protein n=1 Tax=Aquabacterium sp. OR-4 TaxID=2978127 RepID=UPI0021B21DB2|nr:hypothetical protein [Aquabacterium sp. OR-4]MDT7833982.1 hypothetical protein [Aquabacterium sp. OR-4]